MSLPCHSTERKPGRSRLRQRAMGHSSPSDSPKPRDLGIRGWGKGHHTKRGSWGRRDAPHHSLLNPESLEQALGFRHKRKLCYDGS